MSGPSTPGSGPATAACAKQLEPIVIGQTAAFSGVVGSAISNLRTGLSVWAKAVNANGGVQCHPVQLFQVDDGADPARSDQNVKDLVLSKRAVALLGVGAPVQTLTIRAAAEKLKVPVIGGDASNDEWWDSPYMFPQGGYILSSWAGAMRESAAKTGAKKLGIIYCVEANICSSLGKKGPELAKLAGLQLVATKAASLTQSDFTAECQALKDAGAQTVFIALDGSAVQRALRNCKQIGLVIPTVLPSIAINASSAADTNLRTSGGFLGTSVVPFVDKGSAAAKEFTAASAAYAPGVPLDDSGMRGYVSGKMLEKALSNVASEARRGPVTSALIVKGLGMMRQETLGGFTSPMTFTPGKPAPRTSCYFMLELGKDGFTAPLGAKYKCL